MKNIFNAGRYYMQKAVSIIYREQTPENSSPSLIIDVFFEVRDQFKAVIL